jgi:hypothetical protein
VDAVHFVVFVSVLQDALDADEHVFLFAECFVLLMVLSAEIPAGVPVPVSGDEGQIFGE